MESHCYTENCSLSTSRMWMLPGLRDLCFLFQFLKSPGKIIKVYVFWCWGAGSSRCSWKCVWHRWQLWQYKGVVIIHRSGRGLCRSFWLGSNNLCRRNSFITINVINLQNKDCYQRKKQWMTSLDKALTAAPCFPKAKLSTKSNRICS